MASGSNLYNIGIRMTMTENVSPMLTALAGHFLHLHHNINHATAAAQRFRMAVAGAVTAFAGLGLGKGVGHMITAGSHLLGVQQQMTAQGWKQKELAEATAKAYELSAKHQAVGPVEFLEMIKEMTPAVGSREHAVELADLLGKFNVAAQVVLGLDKAQNYSRMIQEAVKSGELSGAILQPKIFERYIDSMARGLKAFGGTVTPHDYNMFMRAGKAAALNWSPEFIETVAPTLMQEQGAPNAGNALLQMYSAIVGGRMWARNAMAFDDLGLIDHSKLNLRTDVTPEGRMKRASAGSVKGWELFASDPDKWMWQYLMPAMVKSGKLSPEMIEEIKKGHIKEGIGHTAMQIVTKEFANLFGRQTAQGVADVLALQIYKIMRDKRLISEAYGLDQGVDFFQNESYQVAIKAFKEQWEGLMTTLGAPSVGIATRALQGVNNALSGMMMAANAHPTAAKVLVATLAGLAAGFVVVGTALVAFAALGGGGLFLVVMTGIATGLGVLAALKWGKIKQAMLYWKAISMAVPAMISNLTNKLIQGILSIPGRLTQAIGAMASQLGSAIGAAIRNAITYWLGLGSGPQGPVHKQNFVPPSNNGSGTRVMRTSLIIDGRALGEAVAYYIAKGSQHVGASADFDGMASPMPADYSPI